MSLFSPSLSSLPSLIKGSVNKGSVIKGSVIKERVTANRGSVLVESIGAVVLVAFMASGLISVAMTLQVRNELRHVAAVAARTGAIAGDSAADAKVRTLLKDQNGVSRQVQRINCNGIDYFEIRLTQSVRTLLGVRKIEGVGHAIAER